MGQRWWDLLSSLQLIVGWWKPFTFIALDLNEPLMLLVVKVGLECSAVKRMSNHFLGQEEGTWIADKLLTLFLDVRANCRAVLNHRNLSGTWSKGSNRALTTGIKAHWGTSVVTPDCVLQKKVLWVDKKTLLISKISC